MNKTQIDGAAAVLFIIGIILLVAESNIGWALIAIAILKQFLGSK